MSNPTTTNPNIRVQTHKYDVCPICDCEPEKVIETVVGGSNENSADTKQVRVCYEPVDPGDGQPARTRLFYHLPGQTGADREGRVELDQAVNGDD